MATMEEIKSYVNDLISSNQDLDALCVIKGSNVVIRMTGQYTRNQVEHLINQFVEIIDYILQDGGGFTEIFYIYQEI